VEAIVFITNYDQQEQSQRRGIIEPALRKAGLFRQVDAHTPVTVNKNLLGYARIVDIQRSNKRKAALAVQQS
jgi:hypothetical protein